MKETHNFILLVFIFIFIIIFNQIYSEDLSEYVLSEEINALTPQGIKLSLQKDNEDDIAICSEKIKTLNGFVRGKLVRSSTGDKLCAFYGIPFGEPPLGNLRFKRPMPVKNWKGIFEANEQPNACVQNSNTLISEDCLYLNIWIPLLIFENRAYKTSPVMIHIHGGRFRTGSISSESYNGALLAGLNNIIVASIQYRLGPLGFLYFGREDAPGNMGLLDQNLAIKWLNDNLSQFGGNPYEITLFGESAGAYSIYCHLLSPLSQPLFKSGIILSSAFLSYQSPTKAIKFSYDFAMQMGCYSIYDDPQKNLDEVMKCLKKIDPSNIVKFSPKDGNIYGETIGVTVDGYFLTDTPENLINKITNIKTKHIIIGNINHEIALYLILGLPYDFQENKTPQFSYDDFLKIIHIMFKDFPEFEIDAIISHYTNWIYLNDGNQNIKRIVGAGTDGYFLCPSEDFAKKWAAKAGSNSKVYFYWFNQKSPDPSRAPWANPYHGDDVEYIFGGPIKDVSRSKGDRELSINIQKLFTRFTRFGLPSKNWKTYTSSHPVFIVFNSTITEKSTSNIFGPHAAHCQFWNYDLPKLRQYYYNTSVHCQNCPRPESLSSTCPTALKL